MINIKDYFYQASSQVLMMWAFSVMVSMLLVLTAIRTHELELTANQIEQVVNNHMVKTKYAAKMRAAARERTLGLHRMILTGDVFSRDEQWIKFNRFGGEFARARLKILAMPLSNVEQEMLDYQGELTREALPLQNRVIEFIEKGLLDKARTVLERGAIPAQDKVLHQLDVFYKYQEAEAEATSIQLRSAYRQSKNIIILLSTLFIVACLVIAITVTRILKRREQLWQCNLDNATTFSNNKSQLIGNAALLSAKQLDLIRFDMEKLIEVAREKSLFNKQFQNPMGDAVIKLDQLAESMDRITNLAKYETGYKSITCEKLNVYELVKSIVGEVEPLTVRNNNTLTMQCIERVGYIIADKEQLSELLRGLLVGACANTDYGIIAINVTREKNNLLFRIEDTGAGIEKEQLEALFDVFHPNHGQSTKENQISLTLASLRRLCQIMGGDFWVESVQNIGSAYIVRLPDDCSMSAGNIKIKQAEKA